MQVGGLAQTTGGQVRGRRWQDPLLPLNEAWTPVRLWTASSAAPAQIQGGWCIAELDSSVPTAQYEPYLPPPTMGDCGTAAEYSNRADQQCHAMPIPDPARARLSDSVPPLRVVRIEEVSAWLPTVAIAIGRCSFGSATTVPVLARCGDRRPGALYVVD